MSDAEADLEKVFLKHYLRGNWKGGYPFSSCGLGSTLEATESIREGIPRLLDAIGASVVFDAPCGDFAWFKEISLPNVTYIGGDIVAPLVELNQSLYGSRSRRFIHCDITKDRLPHADVMICRDCIQHLPNIAIGEFLANFARSSISWLGVTSHVNKVNVDQTEDVRFRSVNLNVAPWNFSEPRYKIDDWVTGKQGERYLSFWRREDVISFISA